MKKYFISLGILYLLSIYNILNAQNESVNIKNEYSTHHLNHVAVFTGLTSELEDPRHFYTIGAEYMYSPRSWEKWSVSVLAEVIFKSHPEWVIAIPFVYQANDKVWLRFGLGAELIRNTEQELDFYKLPLFRIGGGYNFHWKFLSIAPSIDLDVVRNHPAAVIGLNIGYAF